MFGPMRRGLAILLVVLVVLLTATPVLAAEVRSGDTLTVASGEVIDDDLYITGGEITVDGTINGDLVAFGGAITVNGSVNGGVIAAGGTVVLNGKVSRAVRAAGGDLSISGTVGGDLVVAGGQVKVTSTASIGGDVLLGAGSVRIAGPVRGYIKGGSGDVVLSSEVGEDVELGVGRLTLASTAVIRGDLTYISEDEASVQPGSQVMGQTTHQLPEARPEKLAPAFGIVGKVLGFVMALIVGIIIILVARRRAASIADSVRDKPWQSLGWGTLVLIATPIAILLVLITVIGIPLGLIGLALYLIALYLAQVFVALTIGSLILRRSAADENQGLLIGALAIGLAILSLLGLIPYLGFFIGLATIIFGLGALVVSEQRSRAGAG
jgi:cytoskeletal protein CcmA (bactofilin family)